MTESNRADKHRTTRRSISISAVSLLTTLAGCVSSSNQDGSSSSQNSPVEQTQEPTQSTEAPVSYSPTNAQVGEEVTFDASDITELTWSEGFEARDGRVSEYHWDFDNDGIYEGRGVSSSHVYEEPGQHVVSLKMIADCSGFSCGLGFQRNITETTTVSVSVSGESQTLDSSSDIEIDNERVNILLNSVKTRVQESETVNLQFSATNYIGNDQLNVQLLIEVPNNWSVTGAGSVETGSGQYSSTYHISSGNNKSIQIQAAPQQKGRYEITGRIIYYFGDNVSTRQDREFIVPITVI